MKQYHILWMTILLILQLISTISTSRTPSVINNQTFQQLFTYNFDQFKKLMITPPPSPCQNSVLNPTTPYRSYFILFYNPLFQQIYHQFYIQHSTKLIQLLRKRGAREYQQFQHGMQQATQLYQVDCTQFQQFCKFFTIDMFPTFYYLTGVNQNQDTKDKPRGVYQYTSWISVQQMLYFVMKAYSHKMIDLERVKPVHINSELKKKITSALTGETAMYVISFLLFPFLFGYFFIAKRPDQNNIVNAQTNNNKQIKSTTAVNKQQNQQSLKDNDNASKKLQEQQQKKQHQNKKKNNKKKTN